MLLKSRSFTKLVLIAFLIVCGCKVVLSDEKSCSIHDYLRYLSDFGKPLDRANDSRRLLQYCTSVLVIDNHNTNIDSGDTEYAFQLRITERVDLFDDELKSLFSTVPTVPTQPSIIRSALSSTILDYYTEQSKSNTLPGDTEISVDWTTVYNPRGYSVVPSVQNQGVCGACWAFASAASVYASLKLSLYPTTIIRPFLESEGDVDISQSNVDATLDGQNLPHIPVLSAQQLIDCDRTFNTGCNGGSPWYALEYIASNGVVSSADYEFVEKQSTCRSVSDTDNIYFIRHYAMLTPNNENAMLRALNAGPVIIGICGTDLTFLYYASGIYNVDTCCTVQNHAMLLTGYGHDGESGLDYWIAQNSWGVGWGERGYMRILRQSGTIGAFSGGICGLALGPVVSSDGYILGNNTVIGDAGDADTLFQRYVEEPLSEMVNWVEVNWRETAFIIGFLCLLLGIIFMLIGLYLEYLLNMNSRLRAGRRGYVSIPENVAINTAMLESMNSYQQEQQMRREEGEEHKVIEMTV